MYLDQTTATYGTYQVLLGGVAAAVLAYYLGVAVYNVTLHPLAKYPGPKLYGAFAWFDSYSFLVGDREKDLQVLHQQYGPVVRVMPQALSYTSPEAWKDIYGFRQGKRQLQKDPKFYLVDKHDKLPPSLILADDTTHSNGRRLLANAFSDSALRGQEEILNSYFELLLSRLNEQVDGPNKGKVNMVSWYNFTTFDIIGDLALGESFHALENRDYHPWIANIFKVIKMSRWIRLGGTYPIFMKMLNLAIRCFPSIREARRNHMEFVRHKTQARLDSHTDRKDFITYIKNGTKTIMQDNEIIANASLLIIAGSETTATLLSGVTYHLLRNPEKLARLNAEVRGAFSSAGEMSLVSVGKLPYLQATLEEGLRMYPPVPSMLPRRTPPQGDMINGAFVPGNTTVGVHQLSTYRSADNWAEPYTFAPERWLQGDDMPERFRGDRRESLQAFSTGPRNCLGKNLAYNEMRAILARIVWHYDLELMPESVQWSDQKTWLLWEKGPLMVRLSHSGKGQ